MSDYWCCNAGFGRHEPTCQNYGKTGMVPLQKARPVATYQEVLRRHIISCKSMEETYERQGDNVGAIFERGMQAGLERAIEVADNMQVRGV